jgi:hypothetical protein
MFYFGTGLQFSFLYKDFFEIHSEISSVLMHNKGNSFHSLTDAEALLNFKTRVKRKILSIEKSSKLILEKVMSFEN